MTQQPHRESRNVRYRFGELELDLSAFTLSRAGKKLHVTPKVFDLLRHLIENRGRLVTKEELLDTLWADSKVNEGAIPWAMSHLRTALGQAGRDKRPIETVYGRGYRFVADVEVLAGEAPKAPPDVGVDARPPWLEAPFVGREHTMASLQARLSTARVGSGGVCTLVGPAGIGKTRCMEELAELARAEGCDVWSGRSSEDTVAPIFWPWMQVLRAMARDRPRLAEPARALLARLDEGDAEEEEAGELKRATPASSFWLFDGVSSLLSDAAHEGPMLLLFDDLHWADVGSIQLLSFVAPELSRLSVLAVTGQRDGRGARTRALDRLSRHAARIELEPLSPDEVGAYLGAIAQTREPDTALSDALHRATAGNPLYLSQTVRSLISRHGHEALGSLAPELVKPVKSAADVLRASLDPLEPDHRRVLEMASVLGEELEVSTLEAVSEIDAVTLLAALESAEQEGFLVADPPNRFRFRHPLLRSVLYEELAADERARLHRRAAEVIEQRVVGPWRLGEVARHYYRSLALGDYARVAASAQEASRAAARLLAFADAATFARWALEAQALDAGVQPRQRAELLLRCARLEGLSGRAQDAVRTIEELDALARQNDYWDLRVRAARVLRPTHLLGAYDDPRGRAVLEEVLRDAPESERRVHVSALSQLAWIPPYALDMERSKELAGRALSLARELDDDAALFEALNAQLYALSGPDDTAALLAVAEEMLQRDRTPPSWLTMEALVARYGAQIYRGDLTAADATLATMARTAREQKWSEATWAQARMRAQRSAVEGEFGLAETSLAELKTRAQRLGLGYGARLIDFMQATLLGKRDGPVAAEHDWDDSALGRSLHDVMPSLRPGIARVCLGFGQRGLATSVLETMVGDDGAELPREIGYLNALANLALLAVELGDADRAQRLYEQLSPYPHHNTPDCLMWYEGSASHFLAMLAVLLKRPKQAAAHFDDAMAMNERLGVRPQLALTTYEYARFLLAGTRPGRASGRELRDRAVALADDLGMGWLAVQARALG